MREIFKVLEQIKEVLKENEEYGEIEANIENIEYSLRFKAPEDVWNYVYDRLIVKFIPPETEIDYKVLSIWTTKSIAELKEYASIIGEEGKQKMSYMHDFTMKTIKRERVDFIVPERIREACAFREYSLKEGAEKCDIDYKTFCAYASGHIEIPQETILKLSGGLYFPKEFFYWVEWTRT